LSITRGLGKPQKKVFLVAEGVGLKTKKNFLFDNFLYKEVGLTKILRSQTVFFSKESFAPILTVENCEPVKIKYKPMNLEFIKDLK